MRTSRLECGVWAALTFAVGCWEIIFIIWVIIRVSRGTLGMWEPPISTIVALTFLSAAGCYAVHLTYPRRRHSAEELSRPCEQFPEDHQDHHCGEDHEGGSPRVDGGENDAKQSGPAPP